MRSDEYGEPPGITKTLAEKMFDKKSADKKYEKIYTGKTLDKPVRTKLKSEDIFIERQRSKK